MTQTSEKNGRSGPPPKRQSSRKSSASSKIFTIIMEYRDSSLFKWIKLHPEISIGIVALWGMFIIVFLIWFIFSMSPR